MIICALWRIDGPEGFPQTDRQHFGGRDVVQRRPNGCTSYRAEEFASAVVDGALTLSTQRQTSLVRRCRFVRDAVLSDNNQETILHVIEVEQVVLPQCEEVCSKRLLQRVRKDCYVLTCKMAARLWKHAVADGWWPRVHVPIPHSHEGSLSLAHIRSRSDPLLYLSQTPTFICLVVAVSLTLNWTFRQRHSPSLPMIEPMQPIRQHTLLGWWLKRCRHRGWPVRAAPSLH